MFNSCKPCARTTAHLQSYRAGQKGKRRKEKGRTTYKRSAAERFQKSVFGNLYILYKSGEALL